MQNLISPSNSLRWSAPVRTAVRTWFAVGSFVLIAAFAPELRAQEIHWDFEQGLRAGDGWERSGSVFQNQPVQAKATVAADPPMASNHNGNWLIHSYFSDESAISCPSSTGNEHTGWMKSDLFLIQGGTLTFQVGGGSGFATRVELNISNGSLLGDGLDQRVYFASGRNSEAMREVSWSLDEYIGEQAYIRIVDESTESHISADHFRFEPPEPCIGSDCVPPEPCIGSDCVPPEPCIGPDCVPPEPCIGSDCVPPEPCIGPDCGPPAPCIGPDCGPPEPCIGPDCGPPEPCIGPDCGPPEPCIGPDCGPPEPCIGSDCVPPEPCIGSDCVPPEPCIGSDCFDKACGYKDCKCSTLQGLDKLFQWIYCHWIWILIVLIVTIMTRPLSHKFRAWFGLFKRQKRGAIRFEPRPGRGKAAIAPGSRLEPKSELKFDFPPVTGIHRVSHADELVHEESIAP